MIIAVCSCHQQITEDTVDTMNTHGLGNPMCHRWVYVADCIIKTEIIDDENSPVHRRPEPVRNG